MSNDIQEITLNNGQMIKITTMFGTVFISTMNIIGTQVMVYRDPNASPVGYINLTEAINEHTNPNSPSGPPLG